MKINDIKQIAKQHNIKVGKATKTELICAIQQAEGNQSCFASDSATTCEQNACLWRDDCA
jgi:hypothetical protein